MPRYLSKVRDTRDLQNVDKVTAHYMINQHNIDCLTEGYRSLYCDRKRASTRNFFSCSDQHRPSYVISCSRCEIRDHIENNPEAAFIGYTPQM